MEHVIEVHTSLITQYIHNEYIHKEIDKFFILRSLLNMKTFVQIRNISVCIGPHKNKSLDSRPFIFKFRCGWAVFYLNFTTFLCKV